MLPEKLLVLGMGSKVDPSMESIREYFKGSDVKVIGPYVSSCHGNLEIMTKLYSDLQHLADKNVKLVSIEEGGLYFAKPSLAASQTTFPIISRPVDMVAFQADMVPSGNAVIGTVGIDHKLESGYQTDHGKKAAAIAGNIFDLNDDTVGIVTKNSKDESDIKKELEKFNIQTSRASKLILGYHDDYNFKVTTDSVYVWANSREDLTSGDSLNGVEMTLNMMPSAVKVRGKANLANYAAKILSLQRPDIRDKLKSLAEEKKSTYPSIDVEKDLGL